MRAFIRMADLLDLLLALPSLSHDSEETMDYIFLWFSQRFYHVHYEHGFTIASICLG